LTLRNGVDPEDSDWYVVGLIDERLGLTSDALVAYKRVTKRGGPLSPYDLVQQRLPAIGAHH
jgi:hypothetical protein